MASHALWDSPLLKLHYALTKLRPAYICMSDAFSPSLWYNVHFGGQCRCSFGRLLAINRITRGRGRWTLDWMLLASAVAMCFLFLSVLVLLRLGVTTLTYIDAAAVPSPAQPRVR